MEDNDLSFEKGLYTWIRKRIIDRASQVGQEKELPNYKEDPSTKVDASVGWLRDVLQKINDSGKIIGIYEIIEDCEDFIKNKGITHYISAIKLGACEYYVVTSRSQQTKIGVGATASAGSQLAQGGLSGLVAKHWLSITEEQKKIGRIKGETVL